MIPIPWSPFKMDEEGEETKNRFSHESPHKSSSVDVGLRILIQQLSHGKSNVVIKPTLKIKKPTFLANRIDPAGSNEYSSFLKSCCLCNKNLSLDKDVFMYRGDQGFCSIECRSRQIFLDEVKEMEASTKKMVASFRHCRPSDRCETRALLEEFRQRRKPLSCQKDRAIVLL